MATNKETSAFHPAWQVGLAVAGLILLFRFLIGFANPPQKPLPVVVPQEENPVKVGLWTKVPTDPRKEILYFTAPTNGLTYLVVTNGNISNPMRFKGDASPDITDWGNGITLLHFSLDTDQRETNSVVYISREPR